MIKPQPKPVKQKKKSKQEIWHNIVQNELIPQFEKWEITTCELNFYNCVKNRYLGFAHTKKRRYIETPEDLRRVVLACQPCHHVVEYLCVQTTGKTMTNYLEGVIQQRETKLKELGIYF